MKFKKSMILLVLAVFIFATACVCASDVNDTAIASEDDTAIELSQADSDEGISAVENDEIINEVTVGSFSELQNNITENYGSTLILTKDYEHEDDFESDGIIINQSITIDGQGHKIDAQGKSRIFKITADNVVLKNINFINGNTKGQGGAVYFEKSGNVSDCNFTNNNATYLAAFGGAISMDSGSLTNCNFVNNYAEHNGGAVYIMHDSVVTNCNFTDNIALYGGAAYFGSSNATTADCNFINNTATGLGGAICMDSGTIKNCNFTDNTAQYGGAVYVRENGFAEAIGCNFINNSADELGGAVHVYNDGNFTDCNFINNSADWGGAILMDFGYLTGCNFEDNSAGNGSAVYFYIGGKLTDCNFTRNIASGDGGAVYSDNLVTAENCNFAYNNASSKGGAVFFNSNAELTNCNFTGNTAGFAGAVFMNSGNVTGCNFEANNASDGGAVYFDGNGEVTDSNFIGNKATRINSFGGAVFFANDGNVSNCNFTDNSAGYGGAVRFWGNGNVTNCNFADNSAGYGGAVYFLSEGTVSNCNLEANSATNGSAVYFYTGGKLTDSNFTKNIASGDGGAAYFKENGAVENCNFTANTAINSGGAVWMNSGNVTQCTFNRNKAGRDGGAVYFKENGAVENCNFTANTADENGGAVYLNNESNVTNCKFTGNHAYKGGAAYFEENGAVENCNFADNTAGYGGVVYFKVNGELTNCNFTGNSAESNAVVFMNNGTVSNCNFTGNSASIGGAIVGSGTVENCNFADNHASYGGAIAFGGEGTVENCNFVNNNAMDGGAVYFYENGELKNCNFTGNSASYGGAVYFVVSYTGNVTNCNFVNNSASQNGGAVHFWDNGTVTNCSFVNNFASKLGGAVYLDGNGNVTNCDFTGNNATNGSAIYFSRYFPTDVLTVSNSSFLNNRANREELQLIINDNNITIIFTGNDNHLNAIYSKNDIDVTFVNVTYWGANGITNTGNSAITPSRSNREAGQNITVGVLVNGEILLNEVKVTDENGTIVLDITAGESYYISARHDTDSYYTGDVKALSQNMTYEVNVTSQATHNRTVNITATSDVYGDFMVGKIVFIVPNAEIVANYAGDGVWWAVHTFDSYGEYLVNATCVGLNNVTVNNATISITKTNTTLAAETIGSDIVATLKDANGNPLVGCEISVAVGDIILRNITDSNGQINVTPKGLYADTYFASVTFEENEDYLKSSTTVIFIVHKEKSQLTLDNSTGNLLITLNDTNGNPIINATVFVEIDSLRLFITNSSGQIMVSTDGIAPNTYDVIVSFLGNENYRSSTNSTKLFVDKYPTQIEASSVVAVYNNNGTLVATLKDSKGKALSGLKLEILINGTSTKLTTDSDGQVNLSLNDLASNTYNVTVAFAGDDYYSGSSENVTVVIEKAATQIESSDVTAVYNSDGFLVATLKDGNGKALSGVELTVDLNGAKTYVTDENGQIKVSTKGLAPNAYAAKVTFNGDANYNESASDVKVTIKKATPKLTAKKKTFKATVKTKKYAIVLKDNLGKAIKNAKVTLKVKGKTYKATTNSKGKATFKITKLKKLGTFNAVIKYNGNKYYNKVSKKAKIKVVFKTVSKGSKDKSTVKLIQKALKKHGFYLSYNGKHLKVDGIYHKYTKMAVKQFQKSKSLKVTGKVDAKTAKKLGII